MAYLVIRENGCERAVEVERRRITIGNAMGDTVIVNDAQATPGHCVLEETAQGWFAVDLGSSTGTLVNGARLDKRQLSPGDVISIGNAEIYFERVYEHRRTAAQAPLLRLPWWMKRGAPLLASGVGHLMVLWIAAYMILTVEIVERTPPPQIVMERIVPQLRPFEEIEKRAAVPAPKAPQIEDVVQELVVTLEEEVEEVESKGETPKGTSMLNLANKNLQFTGYVDAFGVGGGCAGARGRRTGMFFGKPIATKEVIFVIDRSGSMAWPTMRFGRYKKGKYIPNSKRKIDLAREELVGAIESVPRGTKVAMMCFSTGEVHVWPRSEKPVGMRAVTRMSAVSWAKMMLCRETARGGTSTGDAMAMALKMASPPAPGQTKSATGVYLLTDGAPTTVDGRNYIRTIGVASDGHAKELWDRGEECIKLTKMKILAANAHGARIFTLGMGMDMAVPHPIVKGKDLGGYANDKCRQFLTEIGQETGGSYREVGVENTERK